MSNRTLRVVPIPILLVACSQLDPGPASVPPAEGAVRSTMQGEGRAPLAVSFATSQDDLTSGRTVQSVDFATLRDLWVRVETPHIGPLIAVTTTFVAPSGAAFRTQRTWFSPDPHTTQTTAPDTNVRVPVLPVTHGPNGNALDLFVPVGGTDFLRVPQPGVWQVQVAVDGIGQTTAPLTVDVTR